MRFPFSHGSSTSNKPSGQRSTTWLTQRRWLRLILVILIAFGLRAAYGWDAAAEDHAHVKLIHAVPDLGPVDLLVDGAIVRGDVAYGTAPDFVSVPPGSHAVSVARSGDQATMLLTEQQTFPTGHAFEIVLVEHEGDLTLTAFPVDQSEMPTDFARYRFVYAAATGASIDIVTASGDQIAEALTPLAATAYIEAPEGPARFAVRESGESTTLLDVPEARLVAGTVYDVVLMRAANGRLTVVLVTAPSRTPMEASPEAHPGSARDEAP